MSGRRKVLLLFEYPTLNGGEQSMLAVLRVLARRGDVQFAAACPLDGPLRAALEQLDLRCWPLESAGTTGPGSSTQLLEQQLAAIVPLVRPDLIHANSLTLGRRLGGVRGVLSVPCTAHLRDIIRLNAAAVRDLNCLDGLIAVSAATSEYHVAQGVDATRTTTIHNGVDLQQFSPRSATGFLHRELELPESAKLALTVGQICLRKGHDTLAAAAASLRDRVPEMHWIVCGERYSTKAESIAFEEDFEVAFREAGMADRLHRLGYRCDIAAIMNEADLLVHAARQEPLGRVLLEALASGLPVVATDVGGTREIVEDAVHGLLVPAGSSSALAAAVERLAADAALAASYSTRGRDVAVRRFGIETSASTLCDWWLAGIGDK